MFLRVKVFGRNPQRRYYYLVKTIKVDGKPKQKVIKYLGTIQHIAQRFAKKNKNK